MDFTQLVIGLLGSLAIFLTLRGHKKLGSVIGIIIQPFWIWMSLDKHLPGVFVVSIIYLVVWIYGALGEEK